MSTKVEGRWPKGTVLRCPTCKQTTKVALPVARIDCIGGMPQAHAKKEMKP